MSYLLRPHLISLLTAVKTIYQQKKGQNLTSLISKFILLGAIPTCLQQKLSLPKIPLGKCRDEAYLNH